MLAGDSPYGAYDPDFIDLQAYVRELREVARAQVMSEIAIDYFVNNPVRQCSIACFEGRFLTQALRHYYPLNRSPSPSPTNTTLLTYSAHQEVTIFATAYCPSHRYLLASSNQGRLAIWDLSNYLNPPEGGDEDSTTTPAAPPQPPPPQRGVGAWSPPHFAKSVFSMHLGDNQGIKTSVRDQQNQGLPLLSFQVSKR